MTHLRRIGVVLVLCWSASSPAQAQLVCGLNPLNNEFLSVPSGAEVRFIEVTRLIPGTSLRVDEPQLCIQEPGWDHVSVP
jgi:hypothetical protein